MRLALWMVVGALSWAGGSLPPTSLIDLHPSQLDGVLQRLSSESLLFLGRASPRLHWVLARYPVTWLAEACDPHVSATRLTALICQYPTALTVSGRAALCPISMAQAALLYDRLESDDYPSADTRRRLLRLLLTKVNGAAFLAVVLADLSRSRSYIRSTAVLARRYDFDLIADLCAEIDFRAALASIPAPVVDVVADVVRGLDAGRFVGHDTFDQPADLIARVRALYPAPFDRIFPYNQAVADRVYATIIARSDLRAALSEPGLHEALARLGLRPHACHLLPADGRRLPLAPFALARFDPDLFPAYYGRPRPAETVATVQYNRALADHYLPGLLPMPAFVAFLRRQPSQYWALCALLAQLRRWPLLDGLIALMTPSNAAHRGLARHLVRRLIHPGFGATADPAAGVPTLLRLLDVPGVALFHDPTASSPLADHLFADQDTYRALLYAPRFLARIGADQDAFRAYFRHCRPDLKRCLRRFLEEGRVEAALPGLAAWVRAEHDPIG